ncbi:MAG: acyl-CoA dehydratase activase-related protein [Propionibacteriaceae bacterium]|jgi:predicted CoA-substrate-specific enzyme activase|nr:acyl-CoA dehydratase activase-related protein [Propionibacteriaceae bacterium]
MDDTLALGLDVGSTTVKAVVLDGSAIVFSAYRRHNADVRGELASLVTEVAAAFPERLIKVAMSGSGGLGVAKVMGVRFVQEVISATAAIERLHPEADVVIELGGEDAKITFLRPVPEQRMNGTCAGGTGAFIDQMATLLKTDAAGLNGLALRYTSLYPIASRCGVFAKSDIQPLLNQGAAHEDIAASVFQAVATQTIAGLACGHPIRGRVIFLGGPLHFLSGLRDAYVRALPQVDEFINPEHGELYVAIGAAYLAEGPALSLGHIAASLEAARGRVEVTKVMRPLFVDDAERAAFDGRHAQATVTQGDIATATGALFVGIDAGSTTIKSVVIDQDARILYSSYGSNEGDPIAAAMAISRHIREALPPIQAQSTTNDAPAEEPTTYIARACVTGYGEALVQAATHADEGEIETMAHYRAAHFLAPDVTSVIDIGGQDMKFLRIRNGAVDSIAVNEACSSGCGSFLQTFAVTMNTDIADFAAAGLESARPVDLGSRCTVFMNSSVKQAQKEGASIADISAGLSYSVVRNALYKVIKLRDAGELGSKVVVQGGTFLNDAVLRAFELLTGVEVVRPNIAGLMGAFGAALTARMHWMARVSGSGGTATASLNAHVITRHPGSSSANHDALDGMTQTGRSQTVSTPTAPITISPFQTRDLDAFSVASEQRICQLCPNHCKLTITTFDDGARNVSGNRCERGASLEKRPQRSEIPNLYDYKFQRIFGYRRLPPKDAPRGLIGIPRALGMFEDYPLWHTILTKLGFSVVLSGRSSHELFTTGIESIPAENVCYPAKLAHGPVEWLLDHDVRTIFFPCVNFERKQFDDADNCYNCPIVAYYPQVIEKNIDRLKVRGVRYLDPFVNLNNPENLARRLTEVFRYCGVTRTEAEAAVKAGYDELDKVAADIKTEGDRALQYAREHGLRAIVLAGRPYHIDPEINHGIPEAIIKLGMAVLSEDSLTNGMRTTHLERPIRVMDQWTYHSRLYEAAAQVRTMPDANLVQLNSFGCGVDAITADQVQEILESAGDVYTLIKIDEVSNLGAATIRLRSLRAALADRNGTANAAPYEGVLSEDAAAAFPHPLTSDTAKGTTAAIQALGDETGPHTLAPGTAKGTPHDRPFGVPTSSVGWLTSDTATGTTHDRDRDRIQHAHTPTEPSIPRVSAPPRAPFLPEHKVRHTVFAPQMAPIHFRMLGPIFRRSGYNLVVLEKASAADIECGLKFVHNDACFPAIMVIGQLINAYLSGQADPANSSVAITQTGGMCRATNYVGMLRRGLAAAGFAEVPVLSLSLQGIENNPGFRLTPALIHRAVQGLVIGDTLQNLLLRTRPYERDEGSANELYYRWDTIAQEWFEHRHYSPAYGRRLGYGKLLARMVAEFDALPLLDVPRKPRVGIVGEILVKFQPDANNNVVGVVESEGCEAVLPNLAEFFTYSLAAADWRLDNLGHGDKTGVRLQQAVVWLFERYERPAARALAKTNGKFDVAPSIYRIRDLAEQVISIGTDAGEGWLMVGEMIELIEQGVPNIICCQPFACLPNHVIGRGMFKELRAQHPEANIVSIDYDPGAPEVNQLNRIKLMVATAFRNAAHGRNASRHDSADSPDWETTNLRL